MKTIIIYSGKGGVGKTTTTANIAKSLAKKGEKVFILDADVNTPSMPIVFSAPDSEENILVASLGYQSQKSIYVTDSAIRSYISECIDMVNEFKPTYVLIDTPPSITDVHINLLEKIKPSGLIIVTQPNILSVTDVNRTLLFFRERNVNIIGIIENMCTKESVKADYNWKLLASIPFEKDFNFQTVYNNSKQIYDGIISSIENIESVILENKKRMLFDETITEDEVKAMTFNQRTDLQFINLATWDFVRDLLYDTENDIGGYDGFLDWNTSERIGRMLKVFERDDTGYFMVTKAPNTSIRLIAGEIGQGTLTTAKSYYGVPRIKYKTSQGEVVLFAHEIKPVENKELLHLIGTGFYATKDGRYLPPKEEVAGVYHAFGSRVGLGDNWEELYDNIVSGNLTQINENNVAEIKQVKGKKSRGRARRTIGDLQKSIKNRY